MAALLSLLAALSYGSSDFVGGLASRRTSPWAVAFVSQLGGAAAILVLVVFVGGTPTTSDYAWALLAGAGNGVGTAFLYRGLSAGRMGVVGPVSGVGATLLPVVVGVLGGERPAVLAWLGVLIALPAIWLVAREPGSVAPAGPSSGRGRPRVAAGLVDGILGGLGFGTLFAALAQVPESSGFVPLAVNQVVGAVVVAVVASALGAAWVPRDRAAALGLVTGTLGVAATGLFLVAAQQGLLTVSAVITSLYPAFTVVLAAAILRERVHVSQGLGLGLSATAVVLIALA